MSDNDILQMNNLQKIGISSPEILSAFAKHIGGYEKVGFGKKDIYTQMLKQRRLYGSDAKVALKYL